jgi:hypothetical protein
MVGRSGIKLDGHDLSNGVNEAHSGLTQAHRISIPCEAGRVAKNTSHEVRVKRMASLTAQAHVPA